MKRTFAAAFVLLLVVYPGSSLAFSFDGPFQVMNQFPIFLPLDQPALESTATETSFSVGLSHSSVYVMENSAIWRTDMDLEMTELDLRYKQDIAGLFEFGIDVPVLRASKGFMDRPLAWYHRTFGFGDYGRHNRPRNDFLYEIDRYGAPVILGENDRTSFGDVRLTFKKKILETGPAVSVMGNIELPTGNARIGYGNGSVDYALALLCDMDLSSGARLYANAGAIFPGDLKAYQTVSLRNFYYAGLGIEDFLEDNFSAIAQITAQTSPYPQTGIRQIDGTGLLLILGGRYYTTGGNWELSLSEDPNTIGAPDFILDLTYKKKF